MGSSLKLFSLKIFIQGVLFFVGGFQILCADDYLRLWVSSEIAHQWNWFPDPAFLPGFFWIYALPLSLGLPLKAASFGLTFLFSGFTTVLVYQLSLRLGTSEKVSFWGSLLLTVQPLFLWLNGIPLSETSSGFFLLLGLWLWISSSQKWVGLGVLAFASLFRYEIWPILGILSFFIFREPGVKWKKKIFQLAFLFSGVFLFLAWRFLHSDPSGPLLHVYQQAQSDWYADLNFQKTILGFLAFAPITLLFFGVLIYDFFPSQRSSKKIPIFSFLALGSAGTVIGFFLIHFFLVTFPPRIFYLVSLMVGVAALPSLSLYFSRFSLNISKLTWVLIGSLFVGIGFFPPIEVSPDTLLASQKVQTLLSVLTQKERILIQKTDLGWSTLWGFNHGDSRLIFDRKFLSDPSLLSHPLKVQTLFQQFNLQCALGVYRSMGPSMESFIPSSWEKIWAESKYSLWCSKEIFRRLTAKKPSRT